MKPLILSLYSIIVNYVYSEPEWFAMVVLALTDFCSMLLSSPLMSM